MSRQSFVAITLSVPLLVGCTDSNAPAQSAGAGGVSLAGRGGAQVDEGGGKAGGGGGAGGNGGGAQGGLAGVDLPEGKGWLELPDTRLAAVCACKDGFPEVCANSGCGGIFSWSSGAYDSRRSRLLVFG